MAERGAVRTGDEVRDTITGFAGTVVAVTQWLNGCVRVTVQPRELKDGKPIDTVTFDIEQVELVRATAATPLRKTGGPHPEPTRNTI